MKKFLTAAMAASMVLGGAGMAAAQPHWDSHNNDRQNGRHNDYQSGDQNGYQNGWNAHWRRGHRMDRDHWAHAQRVDWRRSHLRRPPRGYEWREVNGNYVLAAVASGLIADLIINSR